MFAKWWRKSTTPIPATPSNSPCASSTLASTPAFPRSTPVAVAAADSAVEALPAQPPPPRDPHGGESEHPPYDPRTEWAPEESSSGATPPADPHFAFDDSGAPGEEPWRAEGWWLSAAPNIRGGSIAAAADVVPVVLSAWTYIDPASRDEPAETGPRGAPLARGFERIGLLADFERTFSPPACAGLLRGA